MSEQEQLAPLVERLLGAHPDMLTPIGAGLLAASHLGLNSDSRSFAKDMDVAHALVIRECTLLADDHGLLVLEDREEPSGRLFFTLTEKALALLLPPTIDVEAIAMPGAQPVSHTLVAEMPVAMVFDGSSAAVMMASPTDIEDFAIGFARTEGFINSLNEVETLEVVTQQTSEGMTAIEARFWLAPERSEAVAARRRSMAGPIGCGLCGIESIEEATRQVPTLPPGELPMTYDEINQATEQLRAHQPLHDQARAVHGAGFLQPGKGIITAREDVGRHNALDKLLGALIRQDIDPASGAIVMTSRLSVELVQKAAIAGCPAIIAVSAPTAYAVEVATKANITLAALSRGNGFTVFTHGERLGHLST